MLEPDIQKASAPRVSRFGRSITMARAEHLWKAYPSIEVIEYGRVISTREVHSQNALPPILVRDDGKFTLASAEQP